MGNICSVNLREAAWRETIVKAIQDAIPGCTISKMDASFFIKVVIDLILSQFRVSSWQCTRTRSMIFIAAIIFQ